MSAELLRALLRGAGCEVSEPPPEDARGQECRACGGEGSVSGCAVDPHDAHHRLGRVECPRCEGTGWEKW